MTTATKSASGVLTQVVTIGPVHAQRMLADNPVNRHLNERRVRQFAGAMTRGEWQMNGETIKLAEGEVLLDGQHRLAAVVVAQQPQEFLVVSGLPQETQETVDTGKARKVSDLLAMRGYPNVTTVAAAGRGVYLYQTAGTIASQGIRSDLHPTHQQVIATVENHPGIVDTSSFGKNFRPRRLLSSAQLAALRYLFDETDSEDSLVFWTRLSDGIGMEQHDPINTLRERLLREVLDTGSASRLQTVARAAFTVRAFNAWRAGDQLQKLQFKAGGHRPDRFPLIEGCPHNP